MTREITITVTAPIECTEEEFKEWAWFNLGCCGDISIENPLGAYDLEASEVNIH
jgi:hypothetical protein